MPKKQIKGIIAVTPQDKSQFYKEAFVGNVIDEEVKIPKELGTEHPFDFEMAEKVYKKTGIVSGAINKFTDSIVGDFTIKVKNPNVESLLNEFIRDTDFATVLREWIREGLVKGNGFMELDFKENKMRVLNANHMFVKRNRKGKVLMYNQFVGNVKRFTVGKTKITPFEPNQIAHLQMNKIANEAYGIGIIWPNERVIENLVVNEQDLHRLITRKAGAPLHVRVGPEGEHVNTADVQEFKNLLTFMNTRTEWVTDGNVKIEAINMGDLGRGLIETLEHDVEMLSAGMEIPQVLFGRGSIPEGLAKVQLEAFQRKVRSIQEEIESIIEEKIFQPLLIANGFQEDVEFLWNLPGEDEKNKRIEKISSLMNSVSPALRAMFELELARLMDFEDAEDFLMSPDEANKKAEEQEQREESIEREREETNTPQPEVPGAKPNANQSVQHTIQNKNESVKHIDHSEMTIKEFVNLKEFKDFTYIDYLTRILNLLGRDKFETLKALTKEDLAVGLLSNSEVEKLRVILKDGFKNNKTIREIEGRINEDMNLKDRIVKGNVVATGLARANSIARTETVRVSNQALMNLYGENDIQKYRFLAALSDRTCPICEGLNAQVFDIKEASPGVNMPPIHTSCRCSTIAIVE